LGELSGSVEEDGPVAAVWHDPKRGLRNCAIHLHAHLDRVEEVTISIDD